MKSLRERRQALELSQDRLAGILDLTSRTLARYENTNDLPRWLDYALRGIEAEAVKARQMIAGFRRKPVGLGLEPEWYHRQGKYVIAYLLARYRKQATPDEPDEFAIPRLEQRVVKPMLKAMLKRSEGRGAQRRVRAIAAANDAITKAREAARKGAPRSRSCKGKLRREREQLHRIASERPSFLKCCPRRCPVIFR
jgi:transcriptional regulator with XRE-family HTH domain